MRASQVDEPLTRMEAVRRLVFLALLISSCLAEKNLMEPQGKSSCGGHLGEIQKALILNLNANENCTWTIERSENKTIRLIFSHFQLDPGAKCEVENIQIYDGASTEMPLLGKICSKVDYVPVFESSSNSLTFQISTSSSEVQRSAFVFYYYFSSEKRIDNCGGYLDAFGGSFTSPNYPKPHPEFAYCVWHIQVDKGYKINLNFKEIFLEIDDNCRFDFIAVYDGPSTNSGLLAQVCGRIAPTFQSSSNTLTVVLSTDYANSYRGFSASYTPIYEKEVNTSLSCSSDQMTAIISKSYLESLHYNENNLQLNDPLCRPRVSNVLEFSIPLNECGTIKQVKDHTITYTNIITITNSSSSAVITRQKHLQIILKCEMENNSTVEIMYITEDDIIKNITALGKYNISMAFYESESFNKPLLSSPYYVDLNQTLFVQVTLHVLDPNLVVFLDTCTASPTSDLAPPTYDLIKSGCSKDDTCKIYPLSGHYGRFQFSAFKFLRKLGSVYLQCKVLICESNDTQSRCNQGCVSRRKRDISSYKWKTESVIGPIRLKTHHIASSNSEFQNQVHPEESQQAQPFSSLQILSFMVLALNVVIVAAMLVRHFGNHGTECKYQKLQSY
ncbi:CUB and zona pellucida-like domain-containing protein 1 [Antechinus flavipes]|uniref:CUB and zona pellucida-like domain-containing protein 1 n=1 Tax=Antechinus flavipes TaxID=38775 RepID=UPI0022366C1F|nr:CUB and zona pellucida-like domain-containing protein 1 [Antechinus flavipes]